MLRAAMHWTGFDSQQTVQLLFHVSREAAHGRYAKASAVFLIRAASAIILPCEQIDVAEQRSCVPLEQGSTQEGP